MGLDPGKGDVAPLIGRFLLSPDRPYGRQIVVPPTATVFERHAEGIRIVRLRPALIFKRSAGSEIRRQLEQAGHVVADYRIVRAPSWDTRWSDHAPVVADYTLGV